MRQVVLGSSKSVNAAFMASKDQINVSITSVYNKLNGIETNTSAELVRYAAKEAIAIIEALGPRKPLLPGFRIKILDGNCIEAVEHRIKELRSISSGALPGKSLVVFDPALRMPIDVFPSEDGHAQERSLLSHVLTTVEAGDIWISDRNFCVRSFILGIAAKKCFQHNPVAQPNAICDPFHRIIIYQIQRNTFSPRLFMANKFPQTLSHSPALTLITARTGSSMYIPTTIAGPCRMGSSFVKIKI